MSTFMATDVSITLGDSIILTGTRSSSTRLWNVNLPAKWPSPEDPNFESIPKTCLCSSSIEEDCEDKSSSVGGWYGLGEGSGMGWLNSGPAIYNENSPIEIFLFVVAVLAAATLAILSP
jgi:hypothetical protein